VTNAYDRWWSVLARVPGAARLRGVVQILVQDAMVEVLRSVDGLIDRPNATEADILLDVEGRFWAPTSPDRKVRGRLRWNRQLGTLALEGLLRQVPNATTDKLDVIVGRSMLGEPLCLTDCFVHKTQIAVVQHPQTWTVNRTLVGVETPVPQIKGVELRIAGMRGFYGTPLVSPERESAGTREKVTISWQSSPELSVTLDDVQVIFDDDWSVSGTASDFGLHATPRVRLVASHDAVEADLDPLVGPLMLLIGICLNRDVDVDETRLLLVDDQQARRLDGRRVVLDPDSEVQPWLGLGNLEPQQRTFERWFAFCRELPKAIAMVAEYLRAGPATPWEDRLLYLARFVEQYHRARHNSLRMSKADFRAQRKLARDGLGGELGEWVFGLSEHANERALAERLQELVDLYSPALSGALGADSGRFAQETADTRNYYTHYGEHLADKAATEMELVVLTDRLWALVRACLLHEMGFDLEQSQTMLALDSKLGWLSRKA
jgi:hypothetical protein